MSYRQQARDLLQAAVDKLREAGGAAKHLLEAAEQAIKVTSVARTDLWVSKSGARSCIFGNSKRNAAPWNHEF